MNKQAIIDIYTKHKDIIPAVAIPKDESLPQISISTGSAEIAQDIAEARLMRWIIQNTDQIMHKKSITGWHCIEVHFSTGDPDDPSFTYDRFYTKWRSSYLSCLSKVVISIQEQRR